MAIRQRRSTRRDQSPKIENVEVRPSGADFFEEAHQLKLCKFSFLNWEYPEPGDTTPSTGLRK